MSNPEVVQNDQDIIAVDRAFIEELKKKALLNPRKRIRLNLHQKLDDTLHEMIIVHTKETYVRPHKHLTKSESFHVIEGNFDVVIFTEKGDIREVIPMGLGPGKAFCYRAAENTYHGLIPRSDIFVFHEVTNGPFNRELTQFAPWSPEDNTPEALTYLQDLDQKVAAFRR